MELIIEILFYLALGFIAFLDFWMHRRVQREN